MKSARIVSLEIFIKAVQYTIVTSLIGNKGKDRRHDVKKDLKDARGNER